MDTPSVLQTDKKKTLKLKDIRIRIAEKWVEKKKEMNQRLTSMVT